MAMVVHPYIMGAPHRLKYFAQVLKHPDKDGVVFMTGEAILDWYRPAAPARDRRAYRCSRS